MPGVHVVIIDAELMAPVEQGIWCPACLLPSAAAGTFVLTIDGGPRSVFKVCLCHDCGAEVIG